MKTVIYDARWLGAHGIGRFAQEVRQRLSGEITDILGGDPVSPKGMVDLERQLWQLAPVPRDQLFFSPGYNAPVTWRGPLVFTIHDLIHIDVPDERSRFKSLYYERVIKPAMFRANKVLTDSEFSKQRLLEWSGVESSQVEVVGCGVTPAFSPEGPKHQPGYPYILYMRNGKPHKNVSGLLKAFALLPEQDVKLVLNGKPDEQLQHEALRLGIYERVVFAGRIPEEDLPAYYRGAEVVTMPSFYEGFGLPPLEGMASGVPVVVSNTTSLPEVVGAAGLLVDPASREDLADGLSRALTDTALREQLIARGLVQATRFNWDNVAARINQVLTI